MSDAAEAPWLKYQKAAPVEGPWTRYQSAGGQGAPGADKAATGAPAGDAPSMWSSLWSGLVHGAGNVLHGGARIGARMGEATDTGFGPELPPGTTQRVDETAAKRESAYQASPEKKAHPIVSGIGEVVGETAGVAAEMGPLAAAGPATVPWRLAWNSLLGAGASLATPKGGESMSAGAQAGRGALGVAGGAVGAAVGEGGSKIAKYLVGNTPTEIEHMLTRGYRRAVKPSTAGPQSAPRMDKADRDIVGVFDEIADNKAALKYADPITGEVSAGQTPKNVAQFADAIFQRKSAIWNEISEKSANASNKGAIVDLNPMAERLRAVAKEVELANPHAADAILMDADRYAARGSITPKDAEGLLRTFNRETNAWWKNPNSATSQRAHALAEASASLRETLDESITKLEGPGYQQLRNRYGRLKAVEDAVAKAALRDQKNLPAGLVGELLNAGSVTDLLHGIIDPSKLPRAGAMLGAKMWLKKLRDPNAAIARLFRLREASAAGPIGSAISGGVSRFAPPAGGILGGTAAGGLMPQQRELGQFPSMPINP